MRWTKNSGKGGEQRGYHHGNLKEALVRAALELIAEKGPGGFTFAEAARWAGVSPAAPYRHYGDRDELLADVARRGFTLFEQALLEAWNDGLPDTMTVGIVNREAIPGIAVTGQGNARFAMRLVIDRKTGALVSAASTSDRADLVLDIKDAPPVHFTITRELRIEQRKP